MRFRPIDSTLALLGLSAVSALIGALTMLLYMGSHIHDKAFQNGMEFAVENLDIKKMMKENQGFMNTTCHAWWFDSTGKERTLEKRPRP